MVGCVNVVKERYSAVSAPPLLALPHARALNVMSGGPTEQKTLKKMSDSRVRDLLALAQCLEDLTGQWSTEFSLLTVATELRAFCTAPHATHPADLGWFWAGRPDEPPRLTDTGNRFFNSHPQMAWRLIAKFK